MHQNFLRFDYSLLLCLCIYTELIQGVLYVWINPFLPFVRMGLRPQSNQTYDFGLNILEANSKFKEDIRIFIRERLRLAWPFSYCRCWRDHRKLFRTRVLSSINLMLLLSSRWRTACIGEKLYRLYKEIWTDFVIFGAEGWMRKGTPLKSASTLATKLSSLNLKSSVLRGKYGPSC